VTGDGRLPFALPLILPGSGPEAWLAEHLAGRHVARESGSGSPVSLHDVLADGAALLVAAHRRLTADGTPGPAAATYLAGWFAGAVADVTGFVLATAGAGLLLDRDTVRLTLHPDGWPERVDPAGHMVVARDHPWATRRDVAVVEAPEDVVRAAVEALVAVTAPLIEACRGLARVGRVGLWNEVGDRLGAALAFQLDIPVMPAMAQVLEAACSLPGVPWRARPRLVFTSSALLGTVHVAQKGGCCLAHTAPPPAAADEAAVVDWQGYADLPGTPRYCSTCSQRPAPDCDARQVRWLEQTTRRDDRAP
jgi:hypothetical protein